MHVCRLLVELLDLFICKRVKVCPADQRMFEMPILLHAEGRPVRVRYRFVQFLHSFESLLLVMFLVYEAHDRSPCVFCWTV